MGPAPQVQHALGPGPSFVVKACNFKTLGQISLESVRHRERLSIGWDLQEIHLRWLS